MELTGQTNGGNLLHVTSIIVKAARVYDGLPLKWDPACKSIVETSTSHIKRCQIRLIYALVWFGLSAIQVVMAWNKGDYLVRAFGATHIAALITCIASAVISVTKPGEMSNMLTMFVRFEQRRRNALLLHKVNERSILRKAVKLSGLVAAAASAFSILEALNSFINPCFPAFTGYWLNPECIGVVGFLSPAKWQAKYILCKITVYICYFFALSTICQPTILITILSINAAFCIRTYIESCITCLKRNKNLTACAMYREIQILLTIFRHLYFRRAIVGFTGGVLLAQIMLAYGTFEIYKSGKVKEAIEFFVPIAMCVGIIMVLIFGLYGIFGSIYTAGRNFDLAAQRKKAKLKNLRMNKFLKSCPTMKIRIKGSNFVQPLSAITMEDFAWQPTISLLLME